jgi:hypothetical protein
VGADDSTRRIPISSSRIEITDKYRLAAGSACAHSRLPARACSQPAADLPDNLAEETTGAGEKGRSVLDAEKEVAPYARAMVELLPLKSDDELLAIEEAIESKARAGGLPIDLVASGIQITAYFPPRNRSPSFPGRMAECTARRTIDRCLGLSGLPSSLFHTY